MVITNRGFSTGRRRWLAARSALFRTFASGTRFGLVAVVVLLALLGCEDEDRTLNVQPQYQNEDQLIFSSFARLTVHTVSSSPSTACEAFVQEVEAGTSFSTAPIFDSGIGPVCDMREVELKPDERGERDVAVVYAVYDNDSTTLLLRGCELVPAADTTTSVSLSPTGAYFERYRQLLPPCDSVEEKCSSNCSRSDAGPDLDAGSDAG